MRLTTSILLLFIINQLHSQNRIEGSVVDENKRPVPYATVVNSATQRGVITNAEGRFSIDGDLNTIIEISCLGFQSYKGTTALWQDATIVLQTAKFVIDEFVVTPTNAKVIVKEAIRRIDKNYPSGTTKISGIYKQLSMLDDKYTGFFEADMEVYLSNVRYRTTAKTETKVNNFTLYKDSVYYSVTIPRYNLKRFKVHTHPFVSTPNRYSYSYIGKIAYEGTMLIKIAFAPKKKSPNRLQYEGVMYIDEESKAFVYLDYSLIPNQLGFYQLHRFSDFMRENSDMTKIMLKKNGRYYNVSYLLKESSFTIKKTSDSLLTYNYMFNFHTKKIDYKVTDYQVDTVPLSRIIHTKAKGLDSNKKYINDFILETEAEKQLKSESN